MGLCYGPLLDSGGVCSMGRFLYVVCNGYIRIPALGAIPEVLWSCMCCAGLKYPNMMLSGPKNGAVFGTKYLLIWVLGPSGNIA